LGNGPQKGIAWGKGTVEKIAERGGGHTWVDGLAGKDRPNGKWRCKKGTGGGMNSEKAQ